MLLFASAPSSTFAQQDGARLQAPQTQQQQAQAAPLSAASFDAQFTPYNTAPSPITVPPGAVDLNSFEPPAEPAPPEPQSIRNLGSGIASYYGRRFNGRKTANGERFNMRELTAAHKTLPFGSLVRVTNPRNGRAVTVRINDRGPFVKGRVIDLSRAAAREIGMISRGHARVELELVAP